MYIEYISTDEKVAYANPKYPWLVAAAKYKIAYKRPQDYDLVKMKFPEYAKAGEYVIQYSWRGYYDCFDTILVDGGDSSGGGSSPPPQLITETVWIKTDHCQVSLSLYYPTIQTIPSNLAINHCLKILFFSTRRRKLILEKQKKEIENVLLYHQQMMFLIV
jgi:hypothetical protein